MTIRSTAEAAELVCPFSFDAPERRGWKRVQKEQDGGPLLCAAAGCMGWIHTGTKGEPVEGEDAEEFEPVDFGYCARLHPNGVEG